MGRAVEVLRRLSLAGRSAGAWMRGARSDATGFYGESSRMGTRLPQDGRRALVEAVRWIVGSGDSWGGRRSAFELERFVPPHRSEQRPTVGRKESGKNGAWIGAHPMS